MQHSLLLPRDLRLHMHQCCAIRQFGVFSLTRSCQRQGQLSNQKQDGIALLLHFCRRSLFALLNSVFRVQWHFINSSKLLFVQTEGQQR
jgi:hypothetical protein